MDINIKTKFNVGDKVYIPMLYHDFYAHNTPQVIEGIRIDIQDKMRITYLLDGEWHKVSEDRIFATHEECKQWCEKNNCRKSY